MARMCGPDSDKVLHMARVKQLVVDSAKPSALARFWAAVLDDFEVRAYDEAEIAHLASLGRTPKTDPCVIVDGPGLEICFQEVDATPSAKRPTHLDVEVIDRAAENDTAHRARRFDRPRLRHPHLDARPRRQRLLSPDA